MTPAVLLAYNPDDVKPGWIALVLVLVLCVVTYLLWRSMNTQLRRIQLPAKPGRPPIPQSTAPDRPVARPRPASPLPSDPPADASPPEHPEWPSEGR
jgi:hypothetical protein